MYIWDELEEVLETEATDVLHVGQIVDLYIELMTELLQTSADEYENACKAAQMLLNSKVVRSHYSYCRRRLVALLKTKTDQSGEYMAALGALLLQDFDADLVAAAKTLAESGAVPQLIDTLWMFRYTDKAAARIYIGLLYRLCLAQQLPVSDLQSLTYELIEFLYRRVCFDDEVDEDDEALPLLLALNENYAALHSSENTPAENKVLVVLKADLYRYRSIGGKVVLLANRTSSSLIGILVCKFLYFIFTTKETSNFLYTNDLKVLVEVLLRELSDLPVEADDVRQMYLRVLHAVLENTSIAEQKFKQSDVVSVLRCTIESATGETRRLAERCLAVEWLQWSRHGSFVSISSEEASRIDTNSIEENSSDDEIQVVSDLDDSDSDSDRDEGTRTTPSYAVTLRGKPLPPPPRTNILSTSSVNVALARTPPPPPPPPRKAERLH